VEYFIGLYKKLFICLNNFFFIKKTCFFIYFNRALPAVIIIIFFAIFISLIPCLFFLRQGFYFKTIIIFNIYNYYLIKLLKTV